ncbi:VOC family protein [Streptomyces sp. NPDC059578]|uniref:VOC family protein n=1 Tax=Streptomyces sp. NPDC059578 TaxID=3346874 RepID=UPI003684ED16
MPEINEPYAPGTPCWVGLMAQDQTAAMEFYGRLFGWSGEVGPPEFGGYAVMEKDGRAVAGIGPAMAPEGQPEPPHVWTTYLASDDADTTARRITDAGGALLFGPDDVGTLGRMLVASDSTGAVFGVWGHRDFVGAGRVNEPGSVIWCDCNTRDLPAAAAFYHAALGLEARPMVEAPGEYLGLFTPAQPDRPVGGIGAMEQRFPPEVPAHWMTTFAVADLAATVATHTAGGGTVVVEPTSTPWGEMAGLVDPWGAHFGVMQPAG